MSYTLVSLQSNIKFCFHSNLSKKKKERKHEKKVRGNKLVRKGKLKGREIA